MAISAVWYDETMKKRKSKPMLLRLYPEQVDALKKLSKRYPQYYKTEIIRNAIDKYAEGL